MSVDAATLPAPGDGPAPDDTERSTVIEHLAERVRQVGGVIVDFDPDADEVRYERSALAAIRLIVCLVVIGVVAVMAELLPRTQLGLEDDLSRHAGTWVVGIGRFGDAVATVLALLTIVMSLAAAAMARRPRQLATSLAAAVSAAIVVIVAARVGGSSPGRVLNEEWALAAIAAAIAVSVASFSVFSAPVARWSARGISVFTVVGVLGADVSLAVRVMAIFAGGAGGAAVALVFGTASRRIGQAELSAALARAGLPTDTLQPHDGDARGSQPWLATLTTGRDVFVKVAAVDELRADQLFRFWRRLRLRRSDDERSPSSIRRAIEHEAFVAQRASSSGVNTPSVLGLGTLADDRGMFVAFAAVHGATLQDAAEPTDAVLRSAWSQVHILRRSRIAHRDLRAANVMIVGDEAWIIDFGFAEISADEDLLDRDLAEMLVSTATLVGVDRATDNAAAVLGADAIARAIGWIQPLAVSSASRHALPKDDFEALRERVRAAAGISAPELPQLQRVSRKAVISTIALGIAVWAVLPQLTKGINWSTVTEAHLGWAAAAVIASALTYVGAAVSVMGSVADPVPFAPTVAAQLASSFTNRITPAKVGGIALNVRYLIKRGIDPTGASTGVAVSTAAGTVVHITLTLIAVLWAGNVGLPGLHAPSGLTALVVAGIVVAAIVIALLVPPLRRWARHTALPTLRRSLHSFVEVMRSPRNVVMLLGGSALVTIANIVAFDVSLRAFDVAVPISTVAVVYLAGSALASAAPTPGGLGATEAALVAGLSIVAVNQQMAIPAVLLFRLATFWIPILPGWISMTVLQRKGDL